MQHICNNKCPGYSYMPWLIHILFHYKLCILAAVVLMLVTRYILAFKINVSQMHLKCFEMQFDCRLAAKSVILSNLLIQVCCWSQMHLNSKIALYLSCTVLARSLEKQGIVRVYTTRSIIDYVAPCKVGTQLSHVFTAIWSVQHDILPSFKLWPLTNRLLSKILCKYQL